MYHGQDIIRAGIVPADLILNNAQYRPEMAGLHVPQNIYAHIAGIDIVRAPNAQGEGEYYVLEDNLRVPSGVSYMLENRKMMMRLFLELFSQHRIAPVAHYPDLLAEEMRQAVGSPAWIAPEQVVGVRSDIFAIGVCCTSWPRASCPLARPPPAAACASVCG